MKVLVATEETQGHRKTDFCWTEEGELVFFGSECTRETIDGECGCRRSLCGLRTRKATTTFRVVEREELSPGGLVSLLAAGLVAGHFYDTREKARPAAEEDASRLAALASAYPEGAILEKRGNRFLERRRLVG